MLHAPITVDRDRWLRVPLDFTDEPWPDQLAWARWLAIETQPEAPERRERIERLALALAALPSAGVSARYWHYPCDGEPGPALDVAVSRPDPVRLLRPVPPRAVVEPMELPLELPGFDAAARRRSLLATGDQPDGPVLAVVEWAARVDGVVVDMLAADTDPARLSRLVVDGDALLAGLDGRALAAMVEA